MSAHKRVSSQSNKATKQAGKATVPKKEVRKKTKKQLAKKVTKKTVKKVSKRIAQKEVKKPTKKGTRPVTGQSKEIVSQTVREARFGGHLNTMPKNPKAPGRLLGRTITLSLVGISSLPYNNDVVAITLARLGGIAVMVSGVALAWGIFNRLTVETSLWHTTIPVDAQSASMTSVQLEVEALFWYLVAAVAIVAVGSVILLIGHHLAHMQEKKDRALDQLQ